MIEHHLQPFIRPLYDEQLENQAWRIAQAVFAVLGTYTRHAALLAAIRHALVQDGYSRLDAPTRRKFKKGDRVRKISGSSWQGHVVGFYETPLTLDGYVIMSEREINSVQNYPEAALELVPNEEGGVNRSRLPGS